MPESKIIITGTGRAGTTFLVRLLTELGLDTGFDKSNWKESYFTHCEAGLEHAVDSLEFSPRILKSPHFARRMEAMFAPSAAFKVGHVIIPIRDLEDAAHARLIRTR